MKIIVAPDKFKRSLPAAQVAEAIAAGQSADLPRVWLVERGGACVEFAAADVE